MPAVTLPGLQTGIDTQMLVQQLLAVSRAPLTRLETRRGQWQAKTQGFSRLDTRLNTLQGAADELRDAAALRAYTIDSSDETILTVETSTGASEGAHTVVINRLAASERKINDGLATLETLVGEGTFAYTYDGETRVIQTTDETTLEELRDLINNDAGNPGTTASILEYDAGGDNVYHLVLGGNAPGSDYAIAVEDAQTSLDAFKAATFTTTQAAQDSQVRVDGYPAGAWIERSTNSIDDVIPGVTLHLHAAGTVQVSLTRDTESLKGKLDDLVAAYNSAVEYVQAQTGYDAATKTAGILMGEYSLSHVRRLMRVPFIEEATGFLDGTDAYTLAGQIGLSVNSDGLLEVDEDKLDEAISDNYLAVLALLGADRTGASDSEYLRFYGAGTTTTPGTYDVKATFDGGGTLVGAQIKLATEPESAWRDATVNGNLITGAEDEAEEFLQVTATYNGNATETAEVRVRQGVAGRLYDTLDVILDPTDGALTLVEGRCQDAIDLLNASIERQEERLEQTEKRLRAKFARMEQALVLLESQRGALGFGT